MAKEKFTAEKERKDKDAAELKAKNEKKEARMFIKLPRQLFSLHWFYQVEQKAHEEKRNKEEAEKQTRADEEKLEKDAADKAKQEV